MKYIGSRKRCGLKGCNKKYEPVCGTDGKTYLDSCIMPCHLDIQHKGRCEQGV